MKIAFLIIGTQKYLQLAQNCAEKIKRFVKIPNCEVDCHIFSNCPKFDPYHDNNRYHSIDHLPWPLITLLRYHTFLRYRLYLEEYDYLYYIDADMEPIGTIGEEILGNLIATLHPGQTPLPSHLKTFERNPISRACISDRSYNNYYFGALQGGKTEHFLKMCETLKGWIEDDLNKNYIPVYHDESMINKYFMDNPPDRVLGREYAYVEKWFGKPNNQVKIVCIEKDNDKMRKG